MKLTRVKIEAGEYDIKAPDGTVVARARRHEGTPNGYWGAWRLRGRNGYRMDERGPTTLREALAIAQDAYDRQERES